MLQYWKKNNCDVSDAVRSKQGENKDVFNQKYFEIMRNPTPNLLLSYCGDHQIILQKCQTSRVSGSHPQWPPVPVPASFLIKSFQLVEKPNAIIVGGRVT